MIQHILFESVPAIDALPIIRINIWSIVIALLNLLILFLLVKKFLFKPVQRILNERKEQVSRVYDEAQKARDTAEKDRAFYEERREKAEEDAEEIMRKATDQAKRTGESIIKDAKTEATAIMEKAERDIENEKVKAVNDAKNEIASISVQIAEKIVERELKEEDHKAFVDRFVDDLDQNKKA